MTETVIETENLCKQFGRKAALWDVTLKVPRGGVHALIGSNGAGKSTLFRVLLGLTRPTSGQSRVLGVPSEELEPELRGRIGLVTEGHYLPEWMRVDRLVAMQRTQYRQWDEAAFRQVVEHFNVHTDQRVKQLSRGERAGVSLAMALAQRPELLILDEPTLGLDVVAKQIFLDSLLFVVEHDDCTLIYCSHQMDEVERVAETLTLMEKGRVMLEMPVDEVGQRISGWLVGLRPGLSLKGIPGLLSSRHLEDLTELVVLDADERLQEALQTLGAASTTQIPLSFERAINACLSGGPGLGPSDLTLPFPISRAS